MELVFDGSRVTKPRASFMLEKNTQLIVYKWLKSLRFPDGHASNISRLVNMEECRLYGMKDCSKLYVHLVIERFGIQSAVSYWTVNIIDVASKVVPNYMSLRHDCHVFMQTLIPLAIRDLLPKGIWDALTEISHFFRDICFNKLNVDHIERFEKNIIEIICKLEMIFPPSFYYSMDYLPEHLSFEAKVGGLVQYRLMYPFEWLDITVAM